MAKKINKSKGTVILGMSGGVDSSVTALLLKKQGYKVIGVFLRNYPDEEPYLDSICPFKADKEIAESICKKLNIEFQKLDYRSKYLKSVIQPMFKSYASNQTPNPDVYCNSLIKFPALWKLAKSLKADYIATGHYARIKKSKSGFQLLQGKDKTKDQSYFLYKLTQSDLSHTLFPLGNYKKSEIRKIAKSNNLPNWDKQGSRGICFIGNLDFKEFLKRAVPSSPGPVLDLEGNTLGSHPGAIYFTIGERVGPKKGIKIDSKYINLIGNKKIYIAKKIKNKLIVAPENHPSLKKSKITIIKLHKVNPKSIFPKSNIKARIRHLGSLLPGKLTNSKGKLIFILKTPQKEIADGQAVTLYHKNVLIAGGLIKTE